jgi:hypothetical protein
MATRLMSAANSHAVAANRKLKSCEVQTAREVARMVRQLGANGIAPQRER